VVVDCCCYCAVVGDYLVIDEVASSLLFRRAFLRFEGLYPFDVSLAWSITYCLLFRLHPAVVSYCSEKDFVPNYFEPLYVGINIQSSQQQNTKQKNGKRKAFEQVNLYDAPPLSESNSIQP
jgi:hypothetical protein